MSACARSNYRRLNASRMNLVRLKSVPRTSKRESYVIHVLYDSLFSRTRYMNYRRLNASRMNLVRLKSESHVIHVVHAAKRDSYEPRAAKKRFACFIPCKRRSMTIGRCQNKMGSSYNPHAHNDRFPSWENTNRSREKLKPERAKATSFAFVRANYVGSGRARSNCRQL